METFGLMLAGALLAAFGYFIYTKVTEKKTPRSTSGGGGGGAPRKDPRSEIK
jgi:hypothetical protein